MQETCCSGRSNPLCKLVLPATVFLGAFLDVSEERFDSNGIRRLYDGAEYPLGLQPLQFRDRLISVRRAS
jgi:hypothetical protein